MSVSATKLDKDDRRHWHPIQQVTDWVVGQIPEGARVLEIGPGTVKFDRADVHVDLVDLANVPAEKLVKCNIERERLPFPDKSFEFVYSRHMLEDMRDPFIACEEMSRVAKAGYIETPSPVAELCRGVDDGAVPWRGYHHHRFVVWNDSGTLKFVTKYPLIEFVRLDDAKITERLREGPAYWNTYYLWSDHIDFKHVESPLDFDIPREYPRILTEVLNASVEATERFFRRVIGQEPASGPLQQMLVA